MRVIVTVLFTLALGRAQSAETTLERGIGQFRQGHFAEAQQSFEEAVKLSPADARAITYLAITRATLGDCGPWLGELKLQAGRNPDPEIRRLAGLAFVRCMLPTRQALEAVPLLLNLQKAYPDDPDVLYEATRVYNRAWNLTASDLYRKAPQSFRANLLSAEVLETQGRYADAAAEYQKAIDKNPQALSLHYRLGRALLAQQPAETTTLEKARQQFEAELKLNPNDPIAEYQLGQTYLKSQNSEQAAAHFEKAVGLAPGFAEALVALGKLRLENNRYKEAIDLLERAVKEQPALQAAHSTLAMAYRGAGKKKEAQREDQELEKLRQEAPKP